ncbi:MAG TPA: elongation factor P--(R)-beta-lysine ligase [Gammaproteobacteria bacterium]|nr:elongation factor P--(R)-beta-lysine ligase [Gammaproteobacteria bacterium]
MNWFPSATIALLHQRAELIARIRHFFAERQVLEVETPLLSHFTVTDPHVIGIPAIFKSIGSTQEKIMYLQTSPEYAMKRLLAAGSGPIYQITKAFRQGEVGRFHNPEFSMLEWYRPGFDHHALMDEMDALLQLTLNTLPAERLSYAHVFEKYTEIDPHRATLGELEDHLQKRNIIYEKTDRNTCLDLLLTHCIEPQIGRECPIFLYDFPASQAALAKVRAEDPPVASRFEVYFKGIELANGFHELQDANEQRKRFENDLAYRAEHGIAVVPVDEFFLAALNAGIPDSAGVAVGIDRLVMLALEQEKITTILSFDFARA